MAAWLHHTASRTAAVVMLCLHVFFWGARGLSATQTLWGRAFGWVAERVVCRWVLGCALSVAQGVIMFWLLLSIGAPTGSGWHAHTPVRVCIVPASAVLSPASSISRCRCSSGKSNHRYQKVLESASMEFVSLS